MAATTPMGEAWKNVRNICIVLSFFYSDSLSGMRMIAYPMRQQGDFPVSVTALSTYPAVQQGFGSWPSYYVRCR
jgi:hypothetical protein